MKMRYFCDLCGTEVPRNTVRCPTCGRYFTAIQCPRCGFRGEEKDFAQGCPKCGYMKIGGPSAPERTRVGGRRRAAGRKKVRNASQFEPTPQSTAPVFVYRLIGIVLVVILIVLVVVLFLR